MGENMAFYNVGSHFRQSGNPSIIQGLGQDST